MNAVQCDYCGKFAANPTRPGQMMGRYATSLPKTWWAVGAWKGSTEMGASEDSDRGDFCSRECISGHFARPKKEDD